MKCYYLVCCYRDSDNYDATRSCLNHGIFADKTDASNKAAELNQKAAAQWERELQRARNEVEMLQKRWDVLYAAGLTSGDRPRLASVYEENPVWSPGVGDIDYYDVGEADFFPTQQGVKSNEKPQVSSGNPT